MGIYGVPSGLDPIAAWIPSLDTTGNGTTTLTDLIAANNGTLTNMDEDSDGDTEENWVLSGGKHALDFDGSNDQVIIPAAYDFASGGAISLWVDVRDTTKQQQIFCNRFGSANRFGIGINSMGLIGFNWYTGAYFSVSETITTGWHHVVAWHAGSNVVDGYLDGVQMTGTANVNVIQGAFNRVVISGRTHTVDDSFDGMVDDVRLYQPGITVDDVAYLFAFGNGRGITSGGGDSATPILAQLNNHRNVRHAL